MHKFLLNKGFKESKAYGDNVQYFNGDIYTKGTIGVYFSDEHVTITKYHFQGEYSHNNTTGLFSGKIINEAELETIFKMIGVKND